MNDAIRMQISAFVDGELPDNEADLLLRRMGQDAELRQIVAEYLAIGRTLRGEASIPGVGRIHERVSASIDDKPFETGEQAEAAPTSRSIRPLAGAAIAAAVALLAIFGLQQTSSVNGIDSSVPGTVSAGTSADNGYTAEGISDQLRKYYLSHGETATANGANGMNARLVTLRLSEEVLQEPPPADVDADELDSDETDSPPQP